MSAKVFTVEALSKILIEVAGEPESVDVPNLANVELADLGYDSLALLAAISKIERDYGFKVDEEGVSNATTLSDVVELVNQE